MPKTIKKTFEIILGIVLALLILLTAKFVADKALSSTLLAQSQIVGNLLTEDSINIVEILNNPDKIKLIEKFVSSVTEAYVNFELIPYREGNTLVTILKNLEDGVTIDEFSYSGRDIIIKGSGESSKEIERFAENLKQAEYFQGITANYHKSKDRFVFEIICKGHEVVNGQP